VPLKLSRKLIWSFAAFLVLIIPFMGMFPWPLLAHAHAIFIWFVTILLSADFVLNHEAGTKKLDYRWFLPVIIFGYGLVSATLLHGNWKFVFFGVQNLYIGTWTLGCCILAGLLIARKLKLEFLNYFYWSMVALVPGSIILGLGGLLQNERLAGLVLQPDLLAILLGAGLVTALLITLKSRWQYILAGHSILIIGILLTRTRAVIYLLPVWAIFAVIKYRSKVQLSQKSTLYSFAVAAVLILLAIAYAAPRVLSLSRAQFGVSYRADLISHSSKYLAIMPPWGLGPGGLNTVITDYYQMPESIDHTIAMDQKVPENSHNLILDRFLEYGWIAGAAYILLIGVVVWATIRNRHDRLTQALAGVGGYLLVQQLVTSTSLILELLTWICIMGILMRAAREGKPTSKKSLIIGSLIILYIGLLGFLIQIRLDVHTAQLRVANNFVFPLVTSKEKIQEGTVHDDQALAWDSSAIESYHHDYMAADIHAAENTKVIAAKGGEVVMVRNYDTCDLRHFPGVTIYGVDGFYYYYTHLKPGTIKVAVGDNIETGENFALVGSSACAQNTASHLHLDISRFPFTIRRGPGNSSQFTLIDPQPALINAYQELPEK
jgi:hypothetical protein